MKSELTNVDKIHRLPWQVAFGALNVIFCMSAFGSVFILFLSELGLDKARIGAISSLMPFCGVAAILITPFAERVGIRRIFLISWSMRKVAFGFMLLTPWWLARFGPEATFWWVTAVMAIFAICRAIAESTLLSWTQEIIPDSIRGKFSAINVIVSQAISIITLMIAGYVIGHFQGLNRFIYLMVASVAAGFLSIITCWFFPGGAPVKVEHEVWPYFREMLATLKDNNFRILMLGLALVNLGWTMAAGFVPLFMKESIGIATGVVVWLDIAALLGGVVSSYLWGWAADRYGSKPVMVAGYSVMVAVPVLWFLMPRYSFYSVGSAMAIAFLAGWSTIGAAIGFGRYLYCSAVPYDKRTSYMAVFYAIAGLAAGIGPFLGGQLLNLGEKLNYQFSFVHIDAYTPLFALGLTSLIAGTVIFARVHPDGAMTTGRFVSLFFQGNPFLAFGSMIRYRFAKHEHQRVTLTQQLAKAKSPLSTNELVEALEDPSFNVRYEAIMAIAEMPASTELVDGLLLVLGENQPELSSAAAWALGKLGDKGAILPLRETMLSEYPLLKARSARALASLGDVNSGPFLLEKFKTETDDYIRVAYAWSLGMLQIQQAMPDILTFLNRVEYPVARSELAMSAAMLIGQDQKYLRLWRAAKKDLTTTSAQAILAVKKDLKRMQHRNARLEAKTEKTAKAFAQNEIKNACKLLSELLADWPSEIIDPTEKVLFIQCSQKLHDQADRQLEFITLAIHGLTLAAKKLRNSNDRKSKP